MRRRRRCMAYGPSLIFSEGQDYCYFGTSFRINGYSSRHKSRSFRVPLVVQRSGFPRRYSRSWSWTRDHRYTLRRTWRSARRVL